MKRNDYPSALRQFIPPEFDLDRYNYAHKLDSLGWYTNLLRRQVAKEIVDTLPEEQVARSAHLEALLSIMRRECLFGESFFGLLDQTEVESMIAFGMVAESETLDSNRDQLRFRGIRSLSLGDIMAIGGTLRKRPEIHEMVDRHESSGDILKYEHGSKERDLLSKIYFTPFDKFRRVEVGNDVTWAHVVVNLEMPNRMIMESFELWLRDARMMLLADSDEMDFSADGKEPSKQKAKKRVTQREAAKEGKPFKEFSKAQHFFNWGQQRILPYLDVSLWNHLNGRRPTAAEMQNILFPEHPKSERSFYKGTIELVRVLFQEGGMDMLRKQADAEHSLYVQEVLEREWG
jgi:hypothetical protein